MSNVLFLDSDDKNQAIRAIIDHCSAFSSLPDKEAFITSVFKREMDGSTYLRHGVIASHGQIEGLGSARAALGILTPGFDDPSGDRVRFVLVFASDPKRYDLYVALLSTLLKMLRSSSVCPALAEHQLDNPVLKDLLAILDSECQSKKVARKAAFEVLHSETFPSSEKVEQQITVLPSYSKADNIFAFYPMKSEIDVTGVIDHAMHDGKNVWLPVCFENHRMEFALVSGSSWRCMLKKSSNGTMCPVDASFADLSSIGRTLIIIPGLAFDDGFHRLGRGGGFYDAFLQRIVGSERFFRLGICLERQKSIAFPIEPHDQCIDDLLVFK